MTVNYLAMCGEDKTEKGQPKLSFLPRNCPTQAGADAQAPPYSE